MLNQTVIPEITPEDVHEASLGQDILILDVRTPEEYARGHIAMSKLLPFDKLPGQIEALVPDKHARLYIYCFSGSRSYIAVGQLIGMGYTNVFHLPGGLLAWRHQGYPLTTE